MKLAANAVLAYLLPLLVANAIAFAQEPEKESGSGEVYEAVVRYQIKSWDLAASSYCISVDGRDATKDFLKRFVPLPVRTASGCTKKTTQKVLMQVVDKKAGRPSVIFDVAAIHWLTKNEAEVEGGYLCGNLCMASGKYHVVRDGTRWVVTKFDISIQS
jgi:hypothetical protein